MESLLSLFPWPASKDTLAPRPNYPYTLFSPHYQHALGSDHSNSIIENKLGSDTTPFLALNGHFLG